MHISDTIGLVSLETATFSDSPKSTAGVNPFIIALDKMGRAKYTDTFEIAGEALR